MTEERTPDAVLAECPLFRGLRPEEALPVLAGRLDQLPARACLLREGEPLDRLWVLLEGEMHVTRLAPDGSEMLHQQLFPGYLAGGEVACTPGKPSPYSITAQTPCRLWSMPRHRLEDPSLPAGLRVALLENLLYFVANQNMRKYFKIDALSEKSARRRILNYLTARARRAGSWEFDITLDRESLANYLDLNRSVLSHALKDMEREGILRVRKNHFVLFPEKLSG